MKNKLNRYFLASLTLLTLLFSSCTNITGNGMKRKSMVSFTIASEARTAAPSVEKPDDFSMITLDITGNGDPINLSFTSDEHTTAYEKLCGQSTEIQAGTYTFTLKAYFSSSEFSSYYMGEKEQVMAEGENEVSIEISQKAIVFPTGESSDKGKLSLTLTDTSSSPMKKVEAKVLRFNGSTFSEVSDYNKTLENFSSENNKLEWGEINTGLYKVILNFFDENNVQTGINLQYATIVKDAVSRNMETIDAKESKNQVYTITYLTDSDTSFINGLTAPGNYSRFSTLAIPSATKDDNLFLGWYITDEGGNLGEQLKSISPNSLTGNLKLTPKFISKKEEPVLTTVNLEDNSGEKFRFRDTITAKPKCSDSNSFEGTMSYQWYRGDTPIEGATGKSYQLTADDINKNISVKVTQKYEVTPDANISGLYSVTEETRDPVSSGADTVNKGKLSGSVTLNFTSGLYPILIGTSLPELGTDNEDNFKNQANEKVKVHLDFEDNATAPSVSGTVNLIASAQNYETIIAENAAFISVKAHPLTADEANALLSTEIQDIRKGSIAFNNDISGIEYTTTTGSDAPNADSTWTRISSLEVETLNDPSKKKTIDISEPENLYVRKAVVGEKDTAGYVAESEPVKANITNANRGNLITISEAYFLGNPSQLRCGDTINAGVDYSENNHVYNSEIDGTISYKWYYSNGDEWTQAGSGQSYPIASVCVGHKIKLVATQSHPNGRSYIQTYISESDVIKGNLVREDSVISYSETQVIGTSLDDSKLTGGSFTNQAGNIVTPTLSLIDTIAPNKNGTIRIKASLSGYNDLETTATILVKPAVPGLAGYFSTDVGEIPYGYIKFTQKAVDDYLTYSTGNGQWIYASDGDIQAGLLIPVPEHLTMQLGKIDNVHEMSDMSGDIASQLGPYTGTRKVVVTSIELNNNDITLNKDGNTITAIVSGEATNITWETPYETEAPGSANGNTYTFSNNLNPGVYTVIITAMSGNNIVSATALVTIGSN